jgi:tetratricopeptide (TPR) repeat protein
MLDLRPGSISAFTRAAYLRELFGLYPGAVELMNAAFQRTPSREVENRAWILTHLAHLETLRENLDSAERLVSHALQVFPDYHYALGQLAQIRIAQGKYEQAVETQRRRFDSAPHPENLYALADALKRAQRLEEAEDAFRRFELLARKEMDNADNANRELIFFYADHANNPSEALRIARLEFDRRKDVYTRDAYAWALFVNGKSSEARMQIQEALAVGVRDPKVLAHAAKIGDSRKE